MNEIVDDHKRSLKTIGFVPTMGALHRGHISLIEKSVSENDISVCSIFVNPLQFNNKEDLKKYPRDVEKDLEQLKNSLCDYVFTPDPEEFYKRKPLVKMDFGSLGSVLEGKFRPGHFNGVAIVVSKLLHIVKPNSAYFGLKDLQQYYIIRQMCLDLGVPSNIIPCEIVRENNGLAMSSRNRRLNEIDRKNASVIYQCLLNIKNSIEKGFPIEESKKQISSLDLDKKGIEIEYLEFIKLPEFAINPDVQKGYKYALCIAAEISGIRLIDNLVFEL